MINVCSFSNDRRYRYSLEHRWCEKCGGALNQREGSLIAFREDECGSCFQRLSEVRRIMWVGLNPSTADERQLDATLKKIKKFSWKWGFNCFVMTNLFAYRATLPTAMMAVEDPIGPANDDILGSTAAESALVIAAWGADGSFLDRDEKVWYAISKGRPIGDFKCLVRNKDGSPKHPLYVADDTEPIVFASLR